MIRIYWLWRVIGVVAVLALLLAAGGCRTLRVKTDRVVKDSVVIRDSVVVRTVTVVKDSFVITTRDTAIGIAGGSVTLTLSDTTAHLSNKRGNLTVRANRHADGTIHVECTADSLTKVIAALKQILIYRERQIDSVVKTNAVFHHDKSDVTEREKERERSVSFAKWFCWLMLLAIAVVCIYVILKNSKNERQDI